MGCTACTYCTGIGLRITHLAYSGLVRGLYNKTHGVQLEPMGDYTPCAVQVVWFYTHMDLDEIQTY